MREFYILSLKHTRAPHKLVTWWRPNNAGYCWHLPQAGRYTEAQVSDKLFYYNSGCGTIAVPCDMADALAEEALLPHEEKPYRGVRRNHWKIRRLALACPLPFDRPEYREDRWAKIVDEAAAALTP
jgi:hypothetical protein